jgi:DNA polymerase III delta prime subunit
VLVIFGGLPGVGKTTIAQELARQIGAMHVRIDSIEQAIRDCTAVVPRPLDEAGYRVGYAIAQDNLRIGRAVVADSVNPLVITRDAWLKVGQNAQVDTIEIEVICSDSREHRSRVESRLLLIWLLQQAPIGSVKGCPGRRFLRRYGNSKPTSPMKRPASSTWWPVAGLMASSVLDAGISEPTHW